MKAKQKITLKHMFLRDMSVSLSCIALLILSILSFVRGVRTEFGTYYDGMPGSMYFVAGSFFLGIFLLQYFLISTIVDEKMYRKRKSDLSAAGSLSADMKGGNYM